MVSRKLFSWSRIRREDHDAAYAPPSTGGARSQNVDIEAEPKPIQPTITGSTIADSLQLSGLVSDAPPRSEIVPEDRVPDPLGLSVLYDPPAIPSANIIFIHGLGGSSRMTWCKNKQPDLFWPQKWLPMDGDVQKARIFSFGYNARFRSGSQSSTLGIAEFSKNLLFDMVFGKDSSGCDFALGDAPIIFVAHSMGGLVFKRAYLDARLDLRYAKILDAVKGVIFLSTPHRGANLATYLSKLLSISFTSTSKQYVAELHQDGPFLRELNDQFRHAAAGLQLFSFYESLRTPIGVSSALILDTESARLGYPGEISRSLDTDHQNICKYDNPQDPNFKVVLSALKSLVSSASVYEQKAQAEDMSKLELAFGSSSPVDQDLEHFLSKRADGTCQWVLDQEQYVNWSSSSASSLLWLYGRPARGKSVLSSHIAQHLQGTQSNAQYFFFRGGDATKTTITSLLNQLIIQIATHHTGFRRSIVDLVDSGYNFKSTDWKATWKKVFAGILLDMKLNQPMYWIIDGLDEANSPHHIIELMKDLGDSTFPIRAILSSRWQPQLASAIDKVGKSLSSYKLCVDLDTTDFRIYATEELQHLTWPDEIRDNVIDDVVQRSNDNFLWVHLVLNELKDCHTEEDIRVRLEELPPGMDELYGYMENAITRISRSSDKRLSHTIFTWAVHSWRAVSSKELCDVLEPEFGRLLDLSHTLTRLCGHFVTLEGSERVGLIHQTAREYLTGSPTFPFPLKSEESHLELFIQSISPFLDHNFRSRLNGVSLKTFEYRSTSWAQHLAAAKNIGEESQHLDLLMRFFSQSPILNWIYMVASIGQLKVLVETSKALTEFVQRKRKLNAGLDLISRRCDDLEYLDAWSNDLLKIVVKFGSSITQYPDSIYNCIAPLCPSSSAIYKTFGEQQSESVSITDPPQVWDDCLARISVGSGNLAALVCCSGQFIAVTNHFGTTYLWDCTTFHHISEIEHGEIVSSICFSLKGHMFASYGVTTTKLWKPSTGGLVKVFPNNSDVHALCMTFAEDESTLIVGTDRRCLLRLNLNKLPAIWGIIPEVLNESESGGEGMYMSMPAALEISPDGSKVAVTYNTSPPTIWTIEPATVVKRICREHKPGYRSNRAPIATKISWHPSSKEVLGLFMDCCSFKYNLVDGSYEELQPAPGYWPCDIICSPDGLVYAIRGTNGTIKFYDYQSSVLIYQLSSDDIITALCFSRDGKRLFDLRNSFCTVWEPSALIRSADVNDDDTNNQMSDDSAHQSNVVSESFAHPTVPIVLLSPMHHGTGICVGDEEGSVDFFDSAASTRARIDKTATTLSVEHMAWSSDDCRFCYTEVGGRVTVTQLEETSLKPKLRRLQRFRPGLEAGDLAQIMFPGDSSSILLAFQTKTEIWTIESAALHTSYISTSPHGNRKWLVHPSLSDYLISSTPYDIILHLRADLHEVNNWTLDEDPSHSEQDISNMASIDSSSTVERVESAFLTAYQSLALVKISRQTSSRKLRSKFFILDCASIQPGEKAGSTLPTLVKIPDKILDQVEMPLNISANGCLVFVDRSFWVCSWQLKSGKEQVRRHFVLPRDWLPIQGLSVIHMTAAGKILCPRKDGISVISSSAGLM